MLIVDVREQWELEFSHLPDAKNITMATVIQNPQLIPKDRDVVLVCRVGSRTGRLAEWLENAGYTNIFSLDGGMNEWVRRFEPSMREY